MTDVEAGTSRYRLSPSRRLGSSLGSVSAGHMAAGLSRKRGSRGTTARLDLSNVQKYQGEERAISVHPVFVFPSASRLHAQLGQPHPDAGSRREGYIHVNITHSWRKSL